MALKIFLKHPKMAITHDLLPYQTLYHWYQYHGRHLLPWRNTQDPYHIYLSEVMLQQTQVQTVLERFYWPFLNRFPNLITLKNAKLPDILEQWQGLGYYNRARYIHETAQKVAPTLPNNVDALIELPGIGLNTAHAILAFGFQQPFPVMEANVKRILHRITASPHLTNSQLWKLAWLYLDKNHPFRYNQAMMDIGALLCRPEEPKCTSCPLATSCQGQHSPDLFPAPKRHNHKPIKRKQIFIPYKKEAFYAAPRQTRFLHGLYHFYEVDTEQSTLKTIKNIDHVQPLGQITQTYSHFRLEAEIYIWNAEHAQEAATLLAHYHEPTCWHSWAALRQLPFSKAEANIIQLLNSFSDKIFMAEQGSDPNYLVNKIQ
jgi:A/G-specific adenine glycosylase